MNKQGFQKGHAGQVLGAWDMGQVGNPGASPTRHHPRPHPGQTHSRLPPRSPGSTMFTEITYPRKHFLGSRPTWEGSQHPPRRLQGRDRSPAFLYIPMYMLTLSFCASDRHNPKTAAQWQLGGSRQKSQNRQGDQLLSWPQLSTRMGQPLGPTCASCDFQKPTGLC